jgi:cell division protein FtsB
MPTPDAREPLDATGSPGASGVTSDLASGARSGAMPRDLAAVPAFLRRRAGAAGRIAINPPQPRPEATAVPDMASLPMLGIAPRRLVLIGATILLAWLVVSFGRQVAEAAAASSRAEDLRAGNAALAAEVTALQQELEVIQDQRYISQAARAFRLGNPDEIPFALEADAPPLGADAPGSAAARLGADAAAQRPLERWLDVLFGPAD